MPPETLWGKSSMQTYLEIKPLNINKLCVITQYDPNTSQEKVGAEETSDSEWSAAVWHTESESSLEHLPIIVHVNVSSVQQGTKNGNILCRAVHKSLWWRGTPAGSEVNCKCLGETNVHTHTHTGTNGTARPSEQRDSCAVLQSDRKISITQQKQCSPWNTIHCHWPLFNKINCFVWGNFILYLTVIYCYTLEHVPDVPTQWVVKKQTIKYSQSTLYEVQ